LPTQAARLPSRHDNDAGGGCRVTRHEIADDEPCRNEHFVKISQKRLNAFICLGYRWSENESGRRWPGGESFVKAKWRNQGFEAIAAEARCDRPQPWLSATKQQSFRRVHIECQSTKLLKILSRGPRLLIVLSPSPNGTVLTQRDRPGS
jgi:hypothetical protein